MRREQAPEWPWQPTWWGSLVLACGIGLRLYGVYFGYVWHDEISIVLCVAGLCLMIGGWPMWRWAWPGILFLVFMIPLPYRISVGLAGPLQEFATMTSTFLLQTLGVPAITEGQNRILLSETEMAIVEACSGLRMLVVFFALSTAVALVMRRPIWERLLVVVSALPIALAVNIIRITVTGMLYESSSPEVREFAGAFFHDFAGWLMMPVALAFLWVELKLLSGLILEPEQTSPALGLDLAGRRGESLSLPTGLRSSRKPTAQFDPTEAAPPSRRRKFSVSP